MQWYDNFVAGELPLSRFGWVVVTSVSYAVLSLYAHLRKKTECGASDKSKILFVHNLILSIASFIMCCGLAFTSIERISREGWDWLVCEPTEGTASIWSYLYYLSKYYELADTFLAFACRGKGPRHFFMHVYHHFYVLYMAYFYVSSRQSLATVGMLFNTFVHIFMYYYYARAALQLRTPWKNWITRLQIIQFLFSFCLAALAVIVRPSWSQFSSECAGAHPLAANCIFNFTLLLLFFNVLRSSKRARSSSRAPTKAD